MTIRARRIIVWVAAALTGLVCLALGYYFLILDWQGRPVCHKLVNIGFRLWMDDQKTNAFPNAGGASRKSLAMIDARMAPTNWAEHYRYVPGLREDDPEHLVLMYYDRPTRWIWHGSPPTIFKDRAWLVVPVGFDTHSRTVLATGEMSESVSTLEFKRRLQETLTFVRTNARPHWQTIVAEHTRFLESLERNDR